VVVTKQPPTGARCDDRGVEVLGARWRARVRTDQWHGGGPERATRRPATWHNGVKVLHE
jgi:hypothetical protein